MIYRTDGEKTREELLLELAQLRAQVDALSSHPPLLNNLLNLNSLPNLSDSLTSLLVLLDPSGKILDANYALHQFIAPYQLNSKSYFWNLPLFDLDAECIKRDISIAQTGKIVSAQLDLVDPFAKATKLITTLKPLYAIDKAIDKVIDTELRGFLWEAYVLTNIENITHSSNAINANNINEFSSTKSTNGHHDLEEHTIEEELAVLRDSLTQATIRANQLFESNIIGIVITSYKGELIDANTAFLTMLGYDREDLLCQKFTWTSVTKPDHLTIDLKALSEIKHDGFCKPWEKEFLCKDGTSISVLIGGVRSAEDENEAICFILDISNQKQVEAELRESELRLRLAVEATHLGTWDLDLRTGVMICSARCREILGFSSDQEINYKIFLEKLVPGDQQVMNDALVQIFAESYKHKYRIEYRIPIAENLFRWIAAKAQPLFDDEGRPIRMIGTVLDITKRKEVEEEKVYLLMREQAARTEAEAISELLPHVVFTSNNDLSITYYNNYWYYYTGTAQGTGLGREWEEFMHPDDLDNCIKAWQQAVSTGHPLELEIRLLRADGTYRWHLGRTVPIRDSNGTVIKWLGTATDIEDQKRSAETMARLRALEQSNQELQAFAFVASHDLQEPLRKIHAFSNRLQDEFAQQLNEVACDYLARMQNAATRMQRLIADLLAFSRVTTKALPFIAVDLTTIAQEVLSDLEAHIEQTNAAIELGTLPTIDADPLQMRQLLQNLLSNALKFHKPDSKPVIKIYQEQRDQLSYKHCYIIVADNGIGFDEKYLDRIFTLFQRLHTSNQYEGTGLGLAICRKIVSRHGGTITAESSPGQGAKFIIRLPIKQPFEH